jgi:hypothetical protein
MILKKQDDFLIEKGLHVGLVGLLKYNKKPTYMYTVREKLVSIIKVDLNLFLLQR